MQKLKEFPIDLKFRRKILETLGVNQNVILNYKQDAKFTASLIAKRDDEAFLNGSDLSPKESKPEQFRGVFVPESTSHDPESYNLFKKFVLSETELRNNQFPEARESPTYWNSSNFKKIPKERGERVLSVDCEFVETLMGKALARISVISGECEVVYDQLVKPKVRVVNHLTQYSGITKEMLERGPCKTHEQVIQDLQLLMDSNTILVGHSLESDLHCLKLIHRKVVDTSVMFMFSDGRKSSLKSLVWKYLSASIQHASHSPVEDALFTFLVAHKFCTFKISRTEAEEEGESSSLLHQIKLQGLRARVMEPFSLDLVKKSHEAKESEQSTAIVQSTETLWRRYLDAGMFIEMYKSDAGLRRRLIRQSPSDQKYDVSFVRKVYLGKEDFEDFLDLLSTKVCEFDRKAIVVFCNKSESRQDCQLCSFRFVGNN